MSACRACDQPLVIQLDSEDDSATGSSAAAAANSVPDDLTLSCSCHFHWECLFEHADSIATTAQCPACSTALAPAPANIEAFIQSPPDLTASYLNEGGFDPSLAIGNLLAEEAYFSLNPPARRVKAFHMMAGEGDIAGMLELLRDVAAETTDPAEMGDLLRATDPLNGGRTALHVAVQGRQADAAWLMLWMVSSLGIEFFPEIAVNVAREVGLNRLAVESPEMDIRSFRDNADRTAEDLAQMVEFAELLQPGTLTPP
ncbi:hypothetical protein TD95_003691 [Thielaviopsis punctulata]|uniref:Uncharacterized protein n=1 Tax=Thielaviopsis punctulata TaxID=72032 RepID=A0A0F4ZCP8_9PEZI|nr:hypothetical protein TD95_003691 [Thielaviopsis punctulata]